MDILHCIGLHRHCRESQVSSASLSSLFLQRNVNISVALYIASMAEVGQGRTLTRVEIAAVAWGINIISGIVNTVGTKAIGRMSSFNVWWTLGGTIVLVIALLVKAPVKVNAPECSASTHRQRADTVRIRPPSYSLTTKSECAGRRVVLQSLCDGSVSLGGVREASSFSWVSSR